MQIQNQIPIPRFHRCFKVYQFLTLMNATIIVNVHPYNLLQPWLFTFSQKVQTFQYTRALGGIDSISSSNGFMWTGL